MTAAVTANRDVSAAAPARNPLFRALIGLTSLAILLQGVWAGLFLQHENKPRPANWVSVHARGADVAIALAALATVVAFTKLRARRDLWTGTGVLLVALLVESYLGGIIKDGQDWSTVVHIPLAMAITGLAVWLPLRARTRA